MIRLDISIKPPLKWAGGKRWLVPHLLPLWEPLSEYRLVEPLCGGLAVTLGLMPKKVLLNDINPHAINFYKWLKKGLNITIKMENDRELFATHRSRFNQLVANGSTNSKEEAELFYYLNRTCYNGLCRFNSKGEFNVPFGKYKTINYTHDFSLYKKVFKNWELSNVDFEKIPLNENDFIYADPPYDVEFTQYSKENFQWEDQERLASWLARYDGIVVLSNQATDRIMKLYQKLGFKLRLLDAPRMISSDGNRTRVKEVLATKGL
jgi:DNA adenine methylase